MSYMTQHRHSNELDALSRWEAVFAALRAEPRRQLILSLRSVDANHGVPLPMSAVGEQTDQEVDSLRIELIHHHLPLLADQGYIEWEKKPFHAKRGPRFEDIDCAIELIMMNETFIPESLRLTSWKSLSRQ